MRWQAVGLAGLAALGACLDLSTNPDDIAAIEFDDLPWPSIVAGDTLRDSTGAAARLTARLLDGNGDEVTGEVEFLSQDGDVRVAGGAYLVADDTASGIARVLASTTGLQSIVRQVEIVAAPDSMAADGAISPLSWVVPDDPTQNTSAALAVRILHGSGDDAEGVRAWVVSFDLAIEGVAVPRTDTSQVFLVNEAGRISYADTTDASGRASRRLRLRILPGLIAPDSAVITVRASHLGIPLTGGPVRLVLPIRPG